MREHDAELRAPCRQQLRHTLGEPCRETRELGSWIPIPFGLWGALLQVSPCLSCAARFLKGGVLENSRCCARVGTGGVVTSGAVGVLGDQEGFSQGDGPTLLEVPS